MTDLSTHPVAFVAVVKDLAACQSVISEIGKHCDVLKGEGVSVC